jgi:iron(III) transport system substrate-binding protein
MSPMGQHAFRRLGGAFFRLLAAILLSGTGLLSGTAAQAQSGKLVLYTSQPDKIATETVDAFNKHFPTVQVEVFRSGTTEVMNRLQAEFVAGDPKPDLLLIADAATMEQLKADNRLLAFPEAKVAGLPPSAYDVERSYFGTKLITTGIIYHRNAPRKPVSWQDLLTPEAKGQVVLPSPLYSGAAAIHMGAIDAAPELGRDFYRKLAQNGAQAVRGNGAVASAVAGGQKMYGVIVEFMALNAKDKGSPVDFVFPEEGVSVVTEPVAILRTAKNPAAARAFVDFILSRDGQELAVRQGFLPTRADVTPPKGFPALDKITILPVDLKALVAGDEALKKRFTDLFGG